ncbi:MAG: hypothetical protein KDC71_20125, partial [Acidobacteria bacterium]|nr:hypothetical protein [Acidobacteriota bacterium]
LDQPDPFFGDWQLEKECMKPYTSAEYRKSRSNSENNQDFFLDLNPEKGPVPALVVNGDLRLSGDLYNQGLFAPLLIVLGNLRVRNLINASLPILVTGDLICSGFYLGTGGDGPLRIQGDLVAQAYFPAYPQRPENGIDLPYHADGGRLRAPHVSVGPWPNNRQTVFEQLNAELFDTYGDLQVEALLRLQAEGRSFFRKEGDPILSLPPLPNLCAPDQTAPIPDVDALDLSGLGQIKVFHQHLFVPTTEPQKPFLNAWFNEFADELKAQKVLWVPSSVTCEGNFSLDLDQKWLQSHPCVGIIINGDLNINGDLINWSLNQGLTLVVLGALQVHGLYKGGAHLLVAKNLSVRDVLVAEYNDGRLLIGDDLHAPLVISLDHDMGVEGLIQGSVLSSDEMDLEELLSGELFEPDGEISGISIYLAVKADKPLLLTK